MTSPATPDWTLIIAIYGAVLATLSTIISLVLATNELRKTRRSLKIICKEIKIPPLVSLGDDVERQGGHPGIALRVLNVGQRPIEIVSAGFSMNNGQILTHERAVHQVQLPKKLDYSDSIIFEFALSEMKKEANLHGSEVTFAKAIIRDAEDNEYTARLPSLLRGKNL